MTSICDLCEKWSSTIRGCIFGGKKKSICPDCLGQWRLGNHQQIVLYDRNETMYCRHCKDEIEADDSGHLIHKRTHDSKCALEAEPEETRK